MMTYVTAFIFYTLAMIGVMLLAFVVYKKTFMPVNKGENRGVIKIIDSLPIGNKKMLHIIKIKNEKFLIASGLEHTTFLSKLEDDSQIETNEKIIMPEIVEQTAVNIQKEPFVQRFDDAKLSREMELQKQFKELYSKEETPKINSLAANRKEMLKKLLNDLNVEANSKGRN